MLTHQPIFSIVLPVYNEARNIPTLLQRLTDTMNDLEPRYELIFVDDGSVDGSVDILMQYRADEPRIVVLKFSRNFGHHLALSAGLDHAKGEFVVMMDADLQDQPEEIPRLYEALKQGYDVVYGRRRHKKFSWWRRTTASSFRWLMKHWVGFPVPGGVFRIARRKVVDAVCSCRERHRMLVGLMSWVGFRQSAIEVEHGHRLAGESKYDFRRQWRLALDTLTAFSVRPLRLAWWTGLLFSISGLLSAVGVWAGWLFLNRHTPWWIALMCVGFFLGGVQLMAVGIVGEYLGRLFEEVQGRPLYILDDVERIDVYGDESMSSEEEKQ